MSKTVVAKSRKRPDGEVVQRPNPPRCKTHRRLNALSVAQMMVAIQGDALTMHELVEITGLAIMTVRSYVLTLHR